MKKIIILLIILILFTACQPVKKEEKPQVQETPQETEAISGDLGNVDSIDSDLNENELDGLDSGFTDIENI